MKKIAIILILLLNSTLQAQTVIKSLVHDRYADVKGAYYKDIDNDYNNFVGTWKYTNGADTLTVVLQKREMFYNSFSNIYRDMLVGEYRYVKNGVEKVNTISLLGSSSITDFYKHNITGGIILKKTGRPFCEECGENERRVRLMFKDPTRPGLKQGLSADITLRRINEGGVQKIQMFLQQMSSYIPEPGTNPPAEHYSFNLPWGNYTLTKVN